MGRKLGQIEFYCKVEPILRRVKNLNEATICSFNSFYGTKRKPTDKNSIEWWRRQGYRENQNLWCLGRKLYITKPTENINQMVTLHHRTLKLHQEKGDITWIWYRTSSNSTDWQSNSTNLSGLQDQIDMNQQKVSKNRKRCEASRHKPHSLTKHRYSKDDAFATLVFHLYRIKSNTGCIHKKNETMETEIDRQSRINR